MEDVMAVGGASPIRRSMCLTTYYGPKLIFRFISWISFIIFEIFFLDSSVIVLDRTGPLLDVVTCVGPNNLILN